LTFLVFIAIITPHRPLYLEKEEKNMGYDLEFHVMHTHQMAETRGAQAVQVVHVSDEDEPAQQAKEVINHYGGFTSFIAQFVEIDGYDEPTVETQPVLRGFKLYRPTGETDKEQFPNETSTDAYGNPLRFCYAGDAAKAEMSDAACHFDKAMMAYLAALDPDTPLVLYVC
jgi:hypothetical protein